MVPLTRKAFGVLQCLAERRGDLVTKEEILARVWSDTVVGEAVLKVCVREIRRALGDDPQEPRFIATAHRRGYRFIAPVEQVGPRAAAPGGVARPSPGRVAGMLPERRSVARSLVGRDAPLDELRAALGRARAGTRQVIFVTGEAGIGKTSLVDAFLDELAGSDEQVWVARGQCPPQHGAGEAYLPVLEALDGLCRRQGGAALLSELARRAPTWLLQMPSLIDDAQRARLLAQSLGATPQRMLREMVETIAALAADTPLVLLLEDLHWSDPASLDLVSALARRREPAQLLLLATYRPAEVILRQHPLRALKLDLQLYGFGSELSLEFLSEHEVHAVLAERFGDDVAAAFAPLAYRWSDGNPLFLATIGDHLLSSGLVVQSGARFVPGRPADVRSEIPESLRQMVEKRIERLPEDERAVLEAASVAGVEFSSVAVAAALERDPLDVEDLLDRLGRRAELVRTLGTEERPDGSVASRLRFVHALYAEVLYEGIVPTRRAQLHRRIATGEEQSHGASVARIAPMLALHYDRGRDHVQAVKHLRQAAENAAQRSARREAVAFLDRALALVPRFPHGDRVALELAMRERRGLLLHALGDLAGAASELAAVADLAHANGHTDVEVRALVHRATALFLVDRAASTEVFARARAASRELPDPSLALHLQSLAAYNRLRTRGFRAEDRAACAEAVRVLRQRDERSLLGAHCGRSALFENLAGDHASARALATTGLALAVETGDLFEHLLSRYAEAWALLHLGAWSDMQHGLAEEIELAQRNDHPLWAAVFQLQSAWLLVEAGAFSRAATLCESAIAVGRHGRHGLSQTLGHLLLAAAHVGARRPKQGRTALREIDVRLPAEGITIDPTLQPLLAIMRAEVELACGGEETAIAAARDALDLTAETGERTTRVHAQRVLAQVALRGGKTGDAARAIEGALAELAGGPAPLAAWRAHATAAEIAIVRKRRAQAREHWTASAAILRSLAASLDGDDHELRATLLGGPGARRVLEQEPLR
jgi:tetratricopeptide (TPR) repeat protein